MNARVADLITPLTVDRISPLLSLGAIGNTADAQQQQQKNQSLQSQLLQKLSLQNNGAASPDKTPETSTLSEFKAAQFIAGQTYPAQVLAKLDRQNAIENQNAKQNAIVQLNGVTIKMSLNNSVEAGETISLKFMGSEPNPTFLLTQASPTPNVDIARISASAQLIQHYLKPEPKRSSPTLIEARLPITSSPLNSAATMANDLHRAIAQTGLFYESHLAAHIEGKHAMADIMQEPQNHSAQFAEHVVTQQLNLLDQQKLVWHGEVWPQQTMEWEIEKRKNNTPHEPSQATSHNDTIHSKLNLKLPNLGQVSAELHMQNGKLRIQLLATDALTTDTLKNNINALAESLQAAGQTLEQLAVSKHVTQP